MAVNRRRAQEVGARPHYVYMELLGAFLNSPNYVFSRQWELFSAVEIFSKCIFYSFVCTLVFKIHSYSFFYSLIYSVSIYWQFHSWALLEWTVRWSLRSKYLLGTDIWEVRVRGSGSGLRETPHHNIGPMGSCWEVLEQMCPVGLVLWPHLARMMCLYPPALLVQWMTVALGRA